MTRGKSAVPLPDVGGAAKGNLGRLKFLSMKIIRDPVHGYVTLTDQEVLLLDTPLLQRLRHIAQNGPGRLVYPSLLGTRFEHTLGVMQLASSMFDSALEPTHFLEGGKSIRQEFLDAARSDLVAFADLRCDELDEVLTKLRRILRLAALFHDCGHLPLSHSTEAAFGAHFRRLAQSPWVPGMNWHEILGAELVRQEELPLDPKLKRAALLVLLSSGQLSEDVKPVGAGSTLAQSTFATLRELLVGELDADRADYLLRDGYMSGAGFGTFDIQRYTVSMRLCQREDPQPLQPRFEVLPTIKALSTIESALIERYKLYKWVHHHHKVCFFDELVRRTAEKMYARTESDILSDDVAYDRDASPVEQLLPPLGDPKQGLPPLIGFRETTDEDGPWKVLNRDFFFPKTGCFLDDAWFSQALRETAWEGELEHVVDALAYRKQVGVSMWKESQQFDECLSNLFQVAEPITVREHPVNISALQTFLRRPWGFVKEHTDVKLWMLTFSQILERELKEEEGEFAGLCPVVRCDDWYWIGDMKNSEIQSRDESIGFLHRYSPILDELSDLPDNIPYHVFLLGACDAVGDFRRQLETDAAKPRAAVCKALVRALHALLEHDEESVSESLKSSLLDVVKKQ